MVEASLDVQKAIRDKLVDSDVITSLVPATSILDANGRPEQMPCIRIGAGQVLQDEGIARNRWHVYLDLHIFAQEPGLQTVKTVAGAIARVVNASKLFTLDSHYCGDAYIGSARYMRDPDGIHSHAVVTIEARLIELMTQVH